MNANWFPTSGVNGLRFASHLRKDAESRARVVILGSFMGGYHVLSELIFGELSNRVQVVGIATDDPKQTYTNAKVRLWRHPHTNEDETLVRRFAASLDIPVFTGRVKSPEFNELMTQDWKPDLCMMATFGQKIPKHIIEVPRLGFFNFHHSGPTWPSYPGPDPIGAMQRDGLSHLVLTMHRVNELIDDGEFFARSHPVAIPPGINAIEMHLITWPQMAGFIRCAVERILDAATIDPPEFDSMTMHEEPVPYFAGEQYFGRARARRSADHCMPGLRASGGAPFKESGLPNGRGGGPARVVPSHPPGNRPPAPAHRGQWMNEKRMKRSVKTGEVSLSPARVDGWGLKTGAQQYRGSEKRGFGTPNLLANPCARRIITKMTQETQLAPGTPTQMGNPG